MGQRDGGERAGQRDAGGGKARAPLQALRRDAFFEAAGDMILAKAASRGAAAEPDAAAQRLRELERLFNECIYGSGRHRRHEQD